MRKVIMLENGSRDEACRRFEIVKHSIKDFSKMSVSIHGNIRNDKEGWSVVKTYK